MSGPLGLGLPNRQCAAWGPNELELAAELRPSALVVWVYDRQAPEVRGAQVADAFGLALRTGARLLLRPYEPDVPRWYPADWAGECARRAALFGPPGGADGCRIEMIPGNEFNRAGEGGSPAWATGEGPRWLLDFARRYRRLRRGERIHLPAPSPGEGGAEAVAFWEACRRAGVARRFHVVDVHAYSDEQVRTLPRLAHAMLGLPVDLTEWNQADPELVAAEVRATPWLESACYAVPAGAEGQPRPWLAERPDLVAALRRAQDGTVG